MLHLLPHWNWAGKEGQEIDVRALSNCEEVELMLNGASLGRQTMKRNSELKWRVKYAPGTLSARGFIGGKVVAETKIETTGAPAAVQLEPDRVAIHADGQDISIVTVSVRDAQGRLVPVAGNAIQFALDGPGRILGVGNGDPSCHEPDTFVPTQVSRSIPVTGWRWRPIDNPYQENHPESAASFDDAGWTAFDAELSDGPLHSQEHGVFRAHVQVTDQDLAGPVIELRIGKTVGDGFIYVNGRKVGESRDPQAPSLTDVKALLHAGDNTVAVIVGNFGGGGGISKGVTLRLQDPPVQPKWRRSVFNGLAQIIVQGTRDAGDLKLTASADGLQDATATIHTGAAALPASVP